MKVWSGEFSLDTAGHTDVHDITAPVEAHIAESALSDGIATIAVVGSTAAVTTLEFEPHLVQDLKEAAEWWAPSDHPYRHDETWGDANGYSHLRSALMGPSLTLPLKNGKLVRGNWQQIVLVDFDNRPRQRTIVVQVLGR